MAAATVLVCILVIAVGGCLVLASRAVSANDRDWCDTLTLITAHPVAKPANAAANPSRVGQYQLYLDFVKLRREFGC